MSPFSLRVPLSVTALACLTSTSLAQSWSEDFDGYVDGALVDPGGEESIGNGWESWSDMAGMSTVAGPGTSAPAAFSGLNSLSNNPGADTVNHFYDYPDGHPRSGLWAFDGMVFHDAAYQGRTLWILLNTYAFGGPYSWSVQAIFDGDTGMADCDCVNLNVPRPLVRSAWTPFRAEVDLDNDVVDVFYDGFSLTGGLGYSWTGGAFGGAGGMLEIQALDLFPDVPGTPNVTESYYDDLSLTPLPGPIGTLSCSANPNSSGLPASFAAVGTGTPGEPLTVQVAQGPPGNFGFCITSMTSAMVPVGMGFLCVGGNIGRFIPPVFQFNASGVGEVVPGNGPIVLPTDLMPTSPMVPVQAGETWYYQAWFRDGPSFNFTDGLEVTFVPPAPGPFAVVVTDVTPSSAPFGATITVSGSNFDPLPLNNVVFLGDRTSSAFVQTATTTTLTATVLGSADSGVGAVQVVTGAGSAPGDFPVSLFGFGSLRTFTKVFTGSREGAGSSFDFAAATPNTVDAVFDGALRVNVGPLGSWINGDNVLVNLQVHSPIGWTSTSFILDIAGNASSTLDCAEHLGLQLEDLGLFEVGVAGTVVAISVPDADAGFGSVQRVP